MIERVTYQVDEWFVSMIEDESMTYQVTSVGTNICLIELTLSNNIFTSMAITYKKLYKRNTWSLHKKTLAY